MSLSLLLVLLATGCLALHASAALSLLHSLDGGKTYSELGQLSGDPQEDTHLEFSRSPLSARDADQLKRLVTEDGLYYVKLNTPGASFTSLRASCLAAGAEGVKEQIAVHLSTTGAPLGVTYAVASPACRSTGHEGLVQLPASTKVSVTRALLAPSLAVQDAGLGGPEGLFMGQSSHFQGQGAARSQQGAAGTQRGQGAGAAAAGAEGGAEGQRARGQGAPPPPDERTWLQKNWLFVLAGVMMVFNVVAKASGATAAPAAARR